MIIEIDGDITIDTDIDLTAAERHIVQKLFGWKSMVTSVVQFQEKKESALRVGWNNSGPVRESQALALIAQQLEKELRHRLRNSKE